MSAEEDSDIFGYDYTEDEEYDDLSYLHAVEDKDYTDKNSFELELINLHDSGVTVESLLHDSRKLMQYHRYSAMSEIYRDGWRAFATHLRLIKDVEEAMHECMTEREKIEAGLIEDIHGILEK